MQFNSLKSLRDLPPRREDSMESQGSLGLDGPILSRTNSYQNPEVAETKQFEVVSTAIFSRVVSDSKLEKEEAERARKAFIAAVKSAGGDVRHAESIKQIQLEQELRQSAAETLKELYPTPKMTP